LSNYLTASSKLFFSGKDGPAVITERRGLVNYRVKFESGEEKAFHINMLKKYNEREDSVEAPANMPVVNSGQFTNNEADGEEDIMGVIVESEEDCELTQNSAGSDETDIVAAVRVVVDSDSDSDDYQERIEDRSARCYGIAQKETWKDVDVNSDLNKEESRGVWKLIEEYTEIFSDVPTTTHLLEHDIKLTSEEPVYSKPYKLSYNLVEPVEKEIKELEWQGWIEPSDAAYASPIVVAKKKNSDDIRLCVNYKKLNDVTVNDPIPMPEIDDILSGNREHFSAVDMPHGYYAMSMTARAKDYTTFCTPTQNYRFSVMPFELKTVGATFTWLLKNVLKNAKNLENLIDNVIAYNDGFQNQLKTLRV